MKKGKEWRVSDHAAIAWVLDLSRFESGEQARIISLLKKMERELIAKTAAGTTDWSKARIAQQTAEINTVIRRYYDTISGHMVDTTTALAQISATSAGAALSTLTDGAASVLPSESVLRALAKDSLIMGAPQAEWWARQSADVAFRFQAAFRQGLVAAETSQQIIKRVREQMDVTRANAASLVQTSMTSVANESRMEVFSANSDVVTGVKWLATLDSRTCARCGPRDGMTWNLDGSPINATLPFVQPPLHFNDRCVLSPQTRFSTLGGGQRASDAGPVDRKTTFEDFLASKSDAWQNENLGKGRAEMYRDGKITLKDLTSGTGRALSLDELRVKHG